MAAPFLPAGMKAKASRGRIPVSDEDRNAARAGMGGEKTAQAKQAAADSPPTEPVAPVAIEPAAPVAAELVATIADAEPTLAPMVATAPTAAPVTIAPMSEPLAEPTPEPTMANAPAASTVTAAAPAAVATESAALTKPAQPTATPARRGRKPAVLAPGAAPAVLRSLKVPEGSWLEIKVVVAQLSAVEDVPHNIQTYIEAAHKHYEAYLRKQGKLPAK